MNDYQSLILQSLRQEIAFFNAQIFWIGLFTTAVVVGLYLCALHPLFKYSGRLIPFAIASGLFAIGRADLLMHRAGAYTREIEATLGLGSWEAFKTSHAATRVLPFYDVLALTLWAYLLIWSERQACQQLAGNRRRFYVAGTLILVLLGAISIVYAAGHR